MNFSIGDLVTVNGNTGNVYKIIDIGEYRIWNIIKLQAFSIGGVIQDPMVFEPPIYTDKDHISLYDCQVSLDLVDILK